MANATVDVGDTASLLVSVKVLLPKEKLCVICFRVVCYDLEFYYYDEKAWDTGEGYETL